MANKSREYKRPTVVSPLYPIWRVNPNVKHEIIRFVCTCLVMLVTLYLICMISALADSFYIPGKQPPLPDRIHDQILHRREMPKWIGLLVDVFTTVVIFASALRNFLLLPFPFNLQVVSRLITMVIIGFWMRAIAIVVTTVPPSKLNCVPDVPKNAVDYLTVVFRAAADHNRECVGMIISGHSLNILHGVMSLVFYGRAQSAPEKRGKRQGCFCRDVTCKGEQPYDTLEGCFLYQFCACIKLWIKLRKSGCTNPLSTAVTRCFPPVPVIKPQNQEHRRHGPLKKLWSAITRLPILRYFCYIAASLTWIFIPLCYNHYTVDVYFALLLGILWWFVYHLILTILVVQYKGGTKADAAMESVVALRSPASQNEEWQTRESADPNSHNNKDLCNIELMGLDDKKIDTNNPHVHIDVSTHKETSSGSGQSEVGGQGVEAVVTQAVSPDQTTSNSTVPNCDASFQAEFEALNLTWILDFPILKPISWCIRKLEGL